MHDFADVIVASYTLKETDCLPIFDAEDCVIYGQHDFMPIRLEVLFHPKKMIVRKLHIYAPYQKQGLGRTIVEYLKQECSRRHLTEIELMGILSDSTGFWEKCGFSVNGSYGRWEVHEG